MVKNKQHIFWPVPVCHLCQGPFRLWHFHIVPSSRSPAPPSEDQWKLLIDEYRHALSKGTSSPLVQGMAFVFQKKRMCDSTPLTVTPAIPQTHPVLYEWAFFADCESKQKSQTWPPMCQVQRKRERRRRHVAHCLCRLGNIYTHKMAQHILQGYI